MKHHTAFAFSTLFALPLFMCLAQAEEATQPTSSSETYESWNLACSVVPALNQPAAADAAKKEKDPTNKAATADPAKKEPASKDASSTNRRICEASQIFNNNKTGNEVARFSFFYDPQKKDQLLGGLRTFVDTSFEKPVTILDGDKEVLKGAFRRCVGSYCYAVFENLSGPVATMGAAANLALQFPIGNGQVLRIPMSSKGLAASLAALKSRQ